jgi:hypothetical protein
MRQAALVVLAAAALTLGIAGPAFADAGGVPNQPGTLAETTDKTVQLAELDAKQACRQADVAANQRDQAQAQVDRARNPTQRAQLQALLEQRTAEAAEAAAACAVATDNAQKEAASVAGVNGGIASDEGKAALPDVHNTAAGAVSQNMDWLSNSKGINGAFSGANFMHYENLGYDFLVGDGTGGLSIFSLKDPEHPLFVGALRVADLLEPGVDARGLPDAPTRYWEGENMTVDAKRKLVYLARDPRSFGNTQHPNGRSGLYIVDAKDPWQPTVLSFQPVPAGHTATCINDCRYVWSMGPANNGSGVNGQPRDFNGILRPDWSGVPVFVTDVRDPLHPYTYAEPVDQLRNNNHTAYTHSADVDQHGIVWTSGFGGVRGFWTRGLHHDPTTGTDRWATAMDPVPFAGGSIHSNDPNFATSILEHNAFHRTQAASDDSLSTVTAADGRTFNKEDLLYITQENTVSCTSTSGGGSGRFVVATLAGSYAGEDWSPDVSASNKFFLETIGDYSAKDWPGTNPSAGCSAHWFTVNGDMVAIAFYGQGVRVLDMSDPTHPTQAGYIRIPSQTAPNPVSNANNVSAAYWHNGYVYAADYTRGIDVLNFTGEIKGAVQPKICWNACDK